MPLAPEVVGRTTGRLFGPWAKPTMPPVWSAVETAGTPMASPPTSWACVVATATTGVPVPEVMATLPLVFVPLPMTMSLSRTTLPKLLPAVVNVMSVAASNVADVVAVTTPVWVIEPAEDLTDRVEAVVTGSDTLCAAEIESAEVELETTGPPKVTEPVLAVSDRAPLATTELVGAAKVVVTPER